MSSWAGERVEPIRVLHSVPEPVEEPADEIELRARLDQAIADALEIADKVVDELADTSRVAQLVSSYHEHRRLIRWLRRMIANGGIT